MTNSSKAKRSTVNGVEQTYLCYREDNSTYNVPSYFPARGVSLKEACAALGLVEIGRRDVGVAESAGLIVAEIHDGGISIKCKRG